MAVVVALTFACSKEQRAMLAALQGAQEKVASEFKPADVGLNLNETRLNVSIINSELNTADENTRQSRARKAAQIAADSLLEVDDIRVIFVKKSGGVGLTVTTTIASYNFSASEVRTARSGAASS